jgi:glucuronoxylan 4-O-methyltransferase
MEWNNLQQTLLDNLMDQVKDTQMTRNEYKFISDIVHNLNGCNFLIFGTGRDSNLWIESNKNGKTVFLEPDPTWVSIATSTIPDIDVQHIKYSTSPNEYLSLFFEYKKTGIFPKIPYINNDISNTEWDVILIDSPVGAVNGRMCSIYLAHALSNKTNKNTHIFLHDSHRDIETLYSHLFLIPNAKVIEEYNFESNSFTTLNYYVR